MQRLEPATWPGEPVQPSALADLLVLDQYLVKAAAEASVPLLQPSSADFEEVLALPNRRRTACWCDCCEMGVPSGPSCSRGGARRKGGHRPGPHQANGGPAPRPPMSQRKPNSDKRGR